jgi:hypothetical protein
MDSRARAKSRHGRSSVSSERKERHDVDLNSKVRVDDNLLNNDDDDGKRHHRSSGEGSIAEDRKRGVKLAVDATEA